MKILCSLTVAVILAVGLAVLAPDGMPLPQPQADTAAAEASSADPQTLIGRLAEASQVMRRQGEPRLAGYAQPHSEQRVSTR